MFIKLKQRIESSNTWKITSVNRPDDPCFFTVGLLITKGKVKNNHDLKPKNHCSESPRAL